MLFDKSSKSRVKKKERNNIFDEDILFSANKDESQPRSDTRKGYTLQELAEIQRILSKKEDDYYGILNIDKQATGDIINIAYRKLTLRVHPDKFNVSGATEATQKLNKARNELLKKYTDQNKGSQPSKETLTTRSSSSNTNRERKVPNANDKSNPSSTFSKSLVLGASSLPSSKTNPFHKKSSYLLLAFVILIIGIIIFIIYWKKQQRHSYSSTYRNTSKKAKIPSKFDSPASNDGDVITMDEASETSIVQDEE